MIYVAHADVKGSAEAVSGIHSIHTLPPIHVVIVYVKLETVTL